MNDSLNKQLISGRENDDLIWMYFDFNYCKYHRENFRNPILQLTFLGKNAKHRGNWRIPDTSFFISYTLQFLPKADFQTQPSLSFTKQSY